MPKRLDLDMDLIKQDYLNGASTPTLGKKFGCGAEAVRRRLLEMGVTMRPAHRPLMHNCNEHFFDDLSQEHPAYWLGFIMADGNLKERAKYSDVLSVALNIKDANHLEKFKAHIEHTAPVYYHKASAIIRIASQPLGTRLRELGVVPRKSLILQFPDYLPVQSLRHFMRGHVDGDGCLRVDNRGYPQVGIFSGSRNFLVEFKRELCNLLPNINTSVKMYPRGCWEIRWGAKSDCAAIAHLLYDNCTVVLDRKLLSAQELMAFS